MADAEQLLSSCSIDIVVLDTVVGLPQREEASSADVWLELAQGAGARQKAFFDEKLNFYLTLRFRRVELPTELIESDSESRTPSPSALLLSFLTNLQVSIDASYIPSTPQEASLSARPGLPLRTSSAGLTTPRAAGYPLGSAPPLTPSPVPSANETDRKYIYSEGTLLKSFIWGDDPKDEEDAFRLLWSDVEECWLAIYRLHLAVVYVKTPFNNPLLCLTASVTLRDKPLPSTPQRQHLTELLKAAGPLHPLSEVLSPKDKTDAPKTSPTSERPPNIGLQEEVNLLEGLPIDLFGRDSMDTLYLPSNRLGPSARRQYSLPPIYPESPRATTPTPSTSLHILRKSFRKTLGTASGFHVRMRPVMVPHLTFSDKIELDMESSDDESTVVLSIEIENPGDSDSGFAVEGVAVTIKDEDAKIRLIPWGAGGFENPENVFPIFMRSGEQYYLLYAITFLKSPDFNGAPMVEPERLGIFDKIVSIHITGCPFKVPEEALAAQIQAENVSYHTSPFLSKWNCRLDLDPHRRPIALPPDSGEHEVGATALPVPASPFPTAHPRTPHGETSAQLATATDANTKRHTFAGATASVLAPPPRPMSLTVSPVGTPGRLSPSPLGPGRRRPTFSPQPSQLSSMPASPPLPPLPGNSGIFAGPAASLSPPTTAASGSYFNLGLSMPPTPGAGVPPRTPAFPAYGTTPITPRPGSVAPSFSFGQSSSVGTQLDAKRERVVSGGLSSLGFPDGKPWLGQTPSERYRRQPSYAPYAPGGAGKDFAVSIRLIPPKSREADESESESDEMIDAPFRRRRRLIYPLDEFSLEIFVFNQSPYIRTLEVTLPERRPRSSEKQGAAFQASSSKWKQTPPAFMPLQSKIGIGPLGPSTCQSVTMRFLALTVGIHIIDGLILTDLDTGESIRLRSIMDFAVISRTD